MFCFLGGRNFLLRQKTMLFAISFFSFLENPIFILPWKNSRPVPLAGSFRCLHSSVLFIHPLPAPHGKSGSLILKSPHLLFGPPAAFLSSLLQKIGRAHV